MSATCSDRRQCLGLIGVEVDDLQGLLGLLALGLGFALLAGVALDGGRPT